MRASPLGVVATTVPKGTAGMLTSIFSVFEYRGQDPTASELIGQKLE